MTTIAFDPVAFRAQFAAFANSQCYTDAVLQGYFDLATAFVSPVDCACNMLTGAARVQALNLMTAHVAEMFRLVSEGQTPGVMTSATIDKISVTIKPPPDQSQFQAWLSTTPYGQALNALLQVASVGGFYVGGMPERNGFRRAYGGFGGVPGRRFC